MKRFLPLLLLVPLAASAEPDVVSPEDGGSLYVSSLGTSFFPMCRDTSWGQHVGTGSKDARDSQGRRVFSISTPVGGSTVTIAGTFDCSLTASGTLSATWTFTPSADVELNALGLGLKLDGGEFAGGWYGVGSTNGIVFPVVQPESPNLPWTRATAFFEAYNASGERRVRIDRPETMMVSAQDNRKWNESVYELRFELAADQWNALKSFSGGTTYSFACEIALGPDGIVISGADWVGAAGADWIPVEDFAWTKAGTALDLAEAVGIDPPAGKHGRVVRRGSHFEFEELPGVPQRFWGVNVCYGANTPRSNEAEFARTLARMGYNAIRFHHHDMQVTQGTDGTATNLNAWDIDKFDRLAAACVTNGLYLTTDLYVSRNNVTWRAIGIDRDGTVDQDSMKRLLPVWEPALENLLAFARSFLGHVNPFLGRSLAEEPALVGISLVNEGVVAQGTSPASLCSAWPQWRAAWDAWIAAKKTAEPAVYASAPSDPPAAMDRFFMRFLQEKELALYGRIRDFLRDELGCRAPLTSMNGIYYPLAYMAARAEVCDYADDHFYVDHPQFLGTSWQLPSSASHMQPVRNAALGMQPYAARRLADRPYTITEFNYSGPGKYRCSGGLVAGAMAAAQDWDGVWRFDWGSSFDAVEAPWSRRMGYFDVGGDPVQLWSDRVAACLFLRRDLPALPGSLVARVPAEIADGPADGNAQSLESPWRWAGWFARLGYVVGDAVPDGAADLGAHPAASSLSDAAVRAALGLGDALPSNAFGTLGAGGAVVASGTTGAFGVATPRTAGVYAPGGTMEAGPLSATLSGGAASVAAMSVDGRPLAQSNRILVTHLTDAVDTGMTFSNESRTVLKAWGDTPHLMRAGAADVRLAVDAGPSVFEVWSLALDGTRRGKVASSVENGTLRFAADVAADPSRATFLYEIVRAAYPVPVFADERKDGAKPVAFAADGSVFRVTIRNATAGGLYTAYVADAPGGPFSPLASSAKRATADGLLSLDVPAGPSARFVRVGVGN